MEIELALPGRMTTSGSALIRSIQNNTIPVLDLFVRESIQNSLDAALKNEEYVNVEMMVGEFTKRSLIEHLQSGEKFNNKFPKDQYKFVAVKDSHTEGLTGELDFENIKNNEYGNLNKLIYSIGKEQNQSGSGGSWGLGKTVYYRVGIGLVFFYSHVKLADGTYQSRMAATFVENEHAKDSILEGYKGKSKCGIAWWGQAVPGVENQTIPLTDENEIQEILDVFGIERYKARETGTTIIIPFVDEEAVLTDNLIEIDRQRANWTYDLCEYLKISIQRWYIPRLNNKEYPFNNCYLKAYVNGEQIESASFAPIFKKIHHMYRCATSEDKGFVAYLRQLGIEKQDINIRNDLENGKVGTVVYTKVSRDELEMTPPNYLESPYLYCHCDVNDTELNQPIIMYTRKPGMIVSYESIGEWCNGIDKTDKDHFVIGLFVLNSENNLKSEYGVSLEDYIKDCEKSDHNDWHDTPCIKNNKNPRIIKRIKTHVSDKIGKSYAKKENDREKNRNTLLGNKLADLLLPPEGFGRRPKSASKKKPTTSKKIKRRSAHSFAIDNDEIRYSQNQITMNADMVIGKSEKNLECVSGIDAENGFISFVDWENEYQFETPFELNEIRIYSKNERPIILNKNTPQVSVEKMDAVLLKTRKGSVYGFEIHKHSEDEIQSIVELEFDIYRNDLNIKIKERWNK